MNDEPTTSSELRSGRAVVVWVIVAIAAIVAYFALGMPGMDHGPDGGTMDDMEHGIGPSGSAEGL